MASALASALRTAGFKATRPRLAVLRVLAATPKPLPIREIAKRVGAEADQVTVYRIVEAFAKKGLIRETLLGANRAYEYAPTDDHHHVVCIRCGRVEDFEEPSHERLAARVLKGTRSFAKLIGHSFEFTGICVVCARSVRTA